MMSSGTSEGPEGQSVEITEVPKMSTSMIMMGSPSWFDESRRLHPLAGGRRQLGRLRRGSLPHAQVRRGIDCQQVQL